MARSAVALMAVTGFLSLPGLLSEPAEAALVWTGDRTISDNRTYAQETITLAGNLTITGRLTLKGVDLRLDSQVNGSYRIDVAAGGALEVLAGSKLHSTDRDAHFMFQVRPGGSLVMNDSELHDCGWDDIPNWTIKPNADRGLYIEESNVSITNSTLSENYIGLVLDAGTSAFIYHNNISMNHGIGIYIRGGATPTIDHNLILGNLRDAITTTTSAGIVSFASSPVITNNTIAANLDLRSNYNAGGVKLIYGIATLAYNNITGHDSPEYVYGLELYSTSSRVFQNNISNNSNGISAYLASPALEGNVIDGNVAPGSPDYGMGLADMSMLVSANNTYSRNACAVCLDSSSTATFQNDTLVWNERAVDENSYGVAFKSTMTNCTFAHNGWDIHLAGNGYGGDGSVLELRNPSYDPKSVVVSDGGVMLSVKWFARARVLYENGSLPVAGANVGFVNAQGTRAAALPTGADGWTGTVLLEEYCTTASRRVEKSPYNISATKDGRSNFTAGEVVASNREATVILDDIPPALRITGPANNSWANSASVPVGGECEPGAELTVGDAPVSVQPDGRWYVRVPLPAEGPNDIYALARDRCGNVARDGITVFRDTIAPFLVLANPKDGFLTNRSRIAVSGACDPPATVTTVNGRAVVPGPDGKFSTWVDLDEGPNTIVAISRDEANNTARVSVSGELDSLPPMLVVLAPPPGLETSTPEIAVRGVAEEGSNVSVNGRSCPLSPAGFSAKFVLVEGENTIVVTARDRAGNTNSTSLRVVLDTRAPRLDIASPVNGSLLNASTVLVRGSTEAGATVTVDGREAGLAGTDFAFALPLSEGQNTIVVEASDRVGNRARRNITVNIDTIAPALDLESPANRTLTNRTQIDLGGRTEPGAFIIIGDRRVPVEKDGSFLAQVELEREGPNLLTVTARDLAGNAAGESVTVVRDTVLLYNLTSPRNGIKVTTPKTTVSGDAEPGASVTVGGVLRRPGADGRFSLEVPLERGLNRINVTVRDKAGNTVSLVLNVTRTVPAGTAGRGFIPGPGGPLLLAGLSLGLLAAGAGRRGRVRRPS